MIYVFDLDETICTTKGEKFEGMPRLDKYRNAQPIERVVSKLRSLYEEGHTIIIHTARGMLTHNNDVEAVKAELEELTKEWLEENEVPYEALLFGKPYAQAYIDDKALNVADIDKLG